ncbi:hypothetical protein N657DRAFT_647052 [Parathielavia appendiculata]|uniref:Uncharacterized protein n=1 Tax=Parathielavia appendiculata TaxID=2587402 RepID=A0AAN6Z2E0_9PEZI|nr:hypothetical protein N657DRAFT_647052 [Parathielavia appendiculata]
MTVQLRRRLPEDAQTREWAGPSNSIRTRAMHATRSRRIMEAKPRFRFLAASFTSLNLHVLWQLFLQIHHRAPLFMCSSRHLENLAIGTYGRFRTRR